MKAEILHAMLVKWTFPNGDTTEQSAFHSHIQGFPVTEAKVASEPKQRLEESATDFTQSHHQRADVAFPRVRWQAHLDATESQRSRAPTQAAVRTADSHFGNPQQGQSTKSNRTRPRTRLKYWRLCLASSSHIEKRQHALATLLQKKSRVQTRTALPTKDLPEAPFEKRARSARSPT